MKRMIVYSAQIDLVRTRQGAVSSEPDNLASECRWRVEDQRACRASERHRHRTCAGQFERRTWVNRNTDRPVAVQVLLEGGLQRFQRGAAARHQSGEKRY